MQKQTPANLRFVMLKTPPRERISRITKTLGRELRHDPAMRILQRILPDLIQSAIIRVRREIMKHQVPLRFWAILSFSLMLTGSVQSADPLVGDFTRDGQISDADIDLHARVVHRQEYWFDLNNDDEIGESDRMIWIEDLVRTYAGDANLDGSFNTADLVQMLQSGEYEDGIPLNSGWAQGDFDGDGEFNSTDIIYIFTTGCYERGPRSGDGSSGSWSWERLRPGERPEPTPGTLHWFADLNLDQQITAADIDLLSVAAREGNDFRARALFQERGFDLNEDGKIDREDRTVWVEDKDIAFTYFGDANLDRVLDTRDLVQVLQAGKYGQEDVVALWAEGDWDGDFRFDTSDLLLLAMERPADGTRPTRFVSEPAATVLLISTLIGWSLLLRASPLLHRAPRS
jgi:hypothetical protein